MRVLVALPNAVVHSFCNSQCASQHNTCMLEFTSAASSPCKVKAPVRRHAAAATGAWRHRATSAARSRLSRLLIAPRTSAEPLDGACGRPADRVFADRPSRVPQALRSAASTRRSRSASRRPPSRAPPTRRARRCPPLRRSPPPRARRRRCSTRHGHELQSGHLLGPVVCGGLYEGAPGESLCGGEFEGEAGSNRPLAGVCIQVECTR